MRGKVNLVQIQSGLSSKYTTSKFRTDASKSLHRPISQNHGTRLTGCVHLAKPVEGTAASGFGTICDKLSVS